MDWKSTQSIVIRGGPRRKQLMTSYGVEPIDDQVKRVRGKATSWEQVYNRWCLWRVCVLGHRHYFFLSWKGGYFELSAALRKLEMFVRTVFTISEDLEQMILRISLPATYFICNWFIVQSRKLETYLNIDYHHF